MMKRLLVGIVFGIFVFSLHGMSEQSIIPILAARLVNPATREVTEPVKDLLRVTDMRLFCSDLSTVVKVTQQKWVKPDWNFKNHDIAPSVDIDAARRCVDALFIERVGSPAPRILCQGGGLATMLQTCAAICKIIHEFSESEHSALRVLFAYRELKVHFTESKEEHYRAVLRVLGRDERVLTRDIKVPTCFPELITFFEYALPDLNRCDIDYLNMEDEEGLKRFKASTVAKRAFCVAAAPLQAAASVQSLQASFPEATLVGVQTIGVEGAKICEPLYADAGAPIEQLAARLHHIGRELFFINKNFSQQ